MRKILIAVSSFFLFFINVHAFEIDSQHAVLYNLNDNEVIYEIGKDERTSIASLTKIMTTYIAVLNIKDYNQTITIHSNMFYGLSEVGAAVIGLKDNQTVTYNDLLYGMFLGSGADATRAIALTICEKEEDFVALMNQKAEELGLHHTHFVNTVGLDDDNHYSTVDDVAILLKAALENKKFKEIFTTKNYTFSDKTLKVSSTCFKTAEKYGLDISYIIGAKTGYTENASRCLASIALDKEHNISYLLVTTNASVTPNHILDATKVYDYYFKNYQYHNLVDKKDLLVEIPTKYSKQKSVKIYAQQDIKKYLSNDFSKKLIKVNYQGKKQITPNMKRNTKLGKVSILYHDRVVKTIDIFLPKAVKFSILEFIKVHKVIFIIVGGTLLLVSFLGVKIKKRKLRKDKQITII